MYAEAMIAVADVRKSAAWYEKLFGGTADHGREDFDRIMDGERVLVMLHTWGGDEHGAMIAPGDGQIGNGFVLWIHVDDVDEVFTRAKTMNAKIVTQPHDNPQAGWREFTLRDPDGYSIAVAG
jgi:predicted enzyme related to lactoylglutathione lyase